MRLLREVVSGTPPEPSGGHYGQFMIDEPLGWNGIARLAMQEPVIVGLLQVSEIRHFHGGLLWPPPPVDPLVSGLGTDLKVHCNRTRGSKIGFKSF